jgi:hypothetical protein
MLEILFLYTFLFILILNINILPPSPQSWSLRSKQWLQQLPKTSENVCENSKASGDRKAPNFYQLPRGVCVHKIVRWTIRYKIRIVTQLYCFSRHNSLNFKHYSNGV